MKLVALNIVIIISLANCQSEKSADEKTDRNGPEQSGQLTIHNVGLNWSEVIRCNCLFAKTDGNYWRKELFFARDSVGNNGLIQIGETNRATLIPISTPLIQKSKGQEWTEVYSNDTLKITLRGKPIRSKILHTYSYHVAFELIHNGDTVRDEIIGHCSY
ncbi:MAG: hypothetical protein HYZ44_14550 [Bacteroidetes bacterium]|nr:hypothetical protein [Bacteroidota bacterium]